MNIGGRRVLPVELREARVVRDAVNWRAFWMRGPGKAELDPPSGLDDARNLVGVPGLLVYAIAPNGAYVCVDARTLTIYDACVSGRLGWEG